MDFGFSIPGRGPLATREGIRALASRGEELGFACLGVPDHIVVPRNIDSRYPYSPTGSFPGAASGDCVEQLSIMSYLAGITSKVKILASVMVIPHRNAVFAAKALASIDLLSNVIRIDLPSALKDSLYAISLFVSRIVIFQSANAFFVGLAH